MTAAATMTPQRIFAMGLIEPYSLLFLPSCRWFTETHIARLVQPPALHLDPCGELLALYRHPHRTALLLRPVFGIDNLRRRSITVHDDQCIVDRHVEGDSLARSSRFLASRWRRAGAAAVSRLDRFPAL